MDFEKLEREKDEALAKAKRLADQLYSARSQCRHQWGEVKYVPEHRESYTIPGDPPGTMGIDWRGPTHVPAETIKRWSRTCKVCKLTQTTERTHTVQAGGRIPGTSGTVEEPLF